ncbi:hypothetical protein C5167_011898 [Papaver somniferum]|uniref:ATPase AAA-type core domain-containing protein n=1 Tax=Papaver somniferum TaxID=3469 RepID=A0A4Y7IVX8_PAPSO|nr:hypothetical protein C5167_011898 [Papaver somniferum]
MIRVTLLAVTLLGLSEFNYHYLCHHVFIIKRLLGPGNHLGVSGFIQSWVEVHTEFSPLQFYRVHNKTEWWRLIGVGSDSATHLLLFEANIVCIKVGEAKNLVRTLFKVAISRQPSVIFMDEVIPEGICKPCAKKLL